MAARRPERGGREGSCFVLRHGCLPAVALGRVMMNRVVDVSGRREVLLLGAVASLVLLWCARVQNKGRQEQACGWELVTPLVTACSNALYRNEYKKRICKDAIDSAARSVARLVFYHDTAADQRKIQRQWALQTLGLTLLTAYTTHLHSAFSTCFASLYEAHRVPAHILGQHSRFPAQSPSSRFRRGSSVCLTAGRLSGNPARPTLGCGAFGYAVTSVQCSPYGFVLLLRHTST